ncbi:MAG: response regulator [Candidatus Edwardsbacteria bacterium]|nr:response regulator [Candidatus Edwardsbacteria bacterium]
MAKILIVDDEENIRQLYQLELSNAGHEVAAAGTIEQAKDIFERSGTDLVILDLKLTPSDGGLEALKWLRERDRKMPIIINTAYPAYRTDFSSWLADAYLVKSSNLDELKSTIVKLLNA